MTLCTNFFSVTLARTYSYNSYKVNESRDDKEKEKYNSDYPVNRPQDGTDLPWSDISAAGTLGKFMNRRSRIGVNCGVLSCHLIVSA